MAAKSKKALMKKLESLKLDLLGFPYQVEFVEELVNRFNCTGCASVWGSKIQIDPSISYLDIVSAILHEAIEVMFRKTETEYKHEIISRFEVFLMMLIIENPELMEIVLEATKKEGRSYTKRAKEEAKRMVQGSKGKSRVSM